MYLSVWKRYINLTLKYILLMYIIFRNKYFFKRYAKVFCFIKEYSTHKILESVMHF